MVRDVTSGALLIEIRVRDPANQCGICGELNVNLIGFSTGISVLFHQLPGTAVAQWLRCCATKWKVAGSIPFRVTGIFH